MKGVRAADDFEAIRLRLEELRRERQQRYAASPIVERPLREPDAVAHVPRRAVRRFLADRRGTAAR